MLGKYRDLVEVVVGNDVKNLKTLMKTAFYVNSTYEGLKDLVVKLGIKGLNEFFLTQFLMFTHDGQYMPYYEEVLRNLEKTFPWLMKRIGGVSNYEEYNQLCKIVKDSYGFQDLAEVFEYFSHLDGGR